MSNILNIAKSGLNAAQIGLSTTGHNIANANTAGYNRQQVTFGTATSQDVGFGFVGKGTQVTGVARVYNEFLAGRVLAAQSSAHELTSYHTQIKQINNMLADSTAGLSPSLQEFFNGLQAVAADPNSNPARQTLLATGETLAAQFKSLDGQLRDMRAGVNGQITSSIQSINSYAQQIARLNDAIERAQGGNEAKPANDLLDQRDFIVSELSKEIKVSVVKQNSTYNVFIGNGQPLVVNTRPYEMVPLASAADASRLQVGFVENGRTIPLSESMISGGKIGGLFEFRAKTLDQAQNALGRAATGLAMTFNAQHQLGQDRNGNIGTPFFTAAKPLTIVNANNKGTAEVVAEIVDVNALTTSDYQVLWNGTNQQYDIRRLSDGKVTSSTVPVTVDGVRFDVKSGGAPQDADSFLVKPTADGAYGFNVAITDKSKIAAAAPIRTTVGSVSNGMIVDNNTGSGKISAGAVSATTLMAAPIPITYTASANPAVDGTLSGFPAQMPVTVTRGTTTTTYGAGTPVPYRQGDIVSFGGVSVSNIPDTSTNTVNVGPATAELTYDSANNTLNGFPSYVDVTVTQNGINTRFPAGTPVTYTDGATISFGGVSVVMSGIPANGDKFTIARNVNGAGDNRNALLLGALQGMNTLDNGNSTYQGAYAQLVGSIGNKTHELEVTSSAETKLMNQVQVLQQSDSGVNLDEEATNLLRYQQAYAASGKVMQTASKLFDVLLSIGN